ARRSSILLISARALRSVARERLSTARAASSERREAITLGSDRGGIRLIRRQRELARPVAVSERPAFHAGKVIPLLGVLFADAADVAIHVRELRRARWAERPRRPVRRRFRKPACVGARL